MTYRSKAFTLVELLVVIATLAVIAGLLFPVLTDARKSASQTRCSSNFRSAGLAVALYTGDHDETSILASQAPGPDARAETDRTWAQMLRPYVGGASIFRCPNDSFKLDADTNYDPDVVTLDPATLDYEQSRRTNLGYNYLTFSPIGEAPNRKWVSIPANMSSIATPAMTLHMVDSVWSLDSEGKPYGGGHYLVMPPCRYGKVGQRRTDLIDIPNGFRIFMSNAGWIKEASEFRSYGGSYPWHEGRMTTLFADGHVKALTPEEASRGCNVAAGFSGEVLDSTQYIWDAR